MQFIVDYWFEFLCFAVCVIHFIINFIVSIKSGKKINKLCDKCNLPVIGDNHMCYDDLVNSYKSLSTADKDKFIATLINSLSKDLLE